MILLSVTGAPYPKTVTRLEAWGVPADAAVPVLHVAPILFSVGGYFVMRALVAGHGPRTRATIYALCGGVIGFFMAFCLDLFVGVMPALETLTGPLRETGKLDIAAWSMTGLSVFMAAMMGAIATMGSPAARAMAIEQTDAECLEVRDRDRATYAISAAGLLGQGLFVGALAVAHQIDTNAGLVRIGVAIAVAAGALVFAWSSWVLWRKFDEMLRRTVIEAYAWSGLLATIGCLAWAVLESFAVVPAMSAYAAIVAFVALQTFVSLGISSNMTMAPARSKARVTTPTASGGKGAL
jgi:hypothetical protein